MSFWYLYGRSISFPGFSPTRRGRVGKNPGNQVELCTAKYCLLLKAFEKKKKDYVQLTTLNFKNISFLPGTVIRSVISLLVLLIVFIRGSGGRELGHS